MNPDVLAIITARGGSKSVPRKNIALIAGKPLLAWTIGAALNCAALNRVIISTDDEEIAQIGQTWGGEVPFLRPAALARDDSSSMDTIIHAIQWLADHEEYRPDLVMCLQPTSPLCTAQDIAQVIDLARQKQAEGVVSVSPVHNHPYWVKRLTDDGRLENFISPEQPITRRQDLPVLYTLNGAIYLARRRVLLEKRTWYTGQTFAYIMPPERSLDIDTPWDFYLVDLILKDKVQNEAH